jgi:predicted XRE-type DNA-binding protein
MPRKKQTDIIVNEQSKEIKKMKKKMLEAIWGMITNKGLKQNEAAEFLDITQPRVSNIKNGHTDKFSIDKCIELLGTLGHQFVFDYKITMIDAKCEMKVNQTDV